MSNGDEDFRSVPGEPDTGCEPGTKARRRIRNPLTWVLIGLVRGYQMVVSPWFAPTCRYYPSCSAYGLEALRVHGALRGFALAVWRVLRCNPWSRGGVDHVPSAGRWRQGPPADGSEVPEQARTLIPSNSPSSTGDCRRGPTAR